MPKPADAAVPHTDLQPSAALSIIDGPESFASRNVGALGNGTDGGLFKASRLPLRSAAEVGGVVASDDTKIVAKH